MENPAALKSKLLLMKWLIGNVNQGVDNAYWVELLAWVNSPEISKEHSMLGDIFLNDLLALAEKNSKGGFP